MPSSTHAALRRAMRRIASLTCLIFFTGAAAALASPCPVQPTTTPFSQWGDQNSYFLVPGGSFEGTDDLQGWTLDNAAITTGNEPFYVNSSADSQSLVINGGGSATSPFFCVDDTMSDLRLFATELSGGGDLTVDAIVQTAYGEWNVSLADLADGSMASWAPTDPIGGNTGGIRDGDSLMVALRFTVAPSPASWDIDDVYVDPYRAG